MKRVMGLAHHRVSVAQWQSIGARDPTVWGLIRHGKFPRSWQDEKNIFLYFSSKLKSWPSFLSFFTVSEWRRANARNVSFKTLYGGQFTLSTQLIILNYLIASLNFRWASFSSGYENNYAVHGEPTSKKEMTKYSRKSMRVLFSSNCQGQQIDR